MEQGKGGRTDMRQGVMGQWEQERTREMGAAPSSTPMLAMCQLTAGCAVSREVNQPESLLTQWGGRCVHCTCGRLHRGGGI